MNRERALALQERGLHDWIALLGASSPGARVWERDGVIASIVPCCPERSICNSVAYADAEGLGEALDELAAAYEDAGIAAWTVWIPEFDAEAIAVVEAAGHRLDGSPMAMSLELDRFEPLDLGDLDWDRDADPADIGRINDLAYELPGASGVRTALADPPELPELRRYQARVDGEPACVLETYDHERADPRLLLRRHPSRSPRPRARLAAGLGGGGGGARAGPRDLVAAGVADGALDLLAAGLHRGLHGQHVRAPPMSYTDEQLEAAVEALLEPGRFDDAEAIVARAAPGLQQILAQALEAGGWFAESHQAGISGALAIEDPEERKRAMRTVLAEEARMGMMVGVAVGWALAEELRKE